MELEGLIEAWFHDLEAKETFVGETWALLLRLAFHEASTSGSHGCLAWTPLCKHADCEYNNPQHHGLEGITDGLTKFWDDNDIGNRYGLSNGDFWVLAEIVAIRLATGGKLDIPFWYGRPECTGKRWWGDSLPHGTGGLADVQTHMEQKFDLEIEETVALLGAHSLGRMTLSNSHFEGPWTQKMDVLDNSYFKNLWRNTWQAERNPDGNVQWYSSNGLTMLSTDIALAFDHDLSSSRVWCNGITAAKNVHCNVRGDEWSHWVKTFSNDNASWLKYFGSALQKIWLNGNTDLSLSDA